MRAHLNAKLTRSDAGTPMGGLLRRYWQPAALVQEFVGERPVRPVRLLGEDLVLFRDDRGYGLLDRHCAHRGADLCYGRLEDGGLRCPFHGWLFDRAGRCLEQPAEPADSTLYRRVRQTAYPCVEKNGIVFAYLGPGEPPPSPALDCFDAPDGHTFAFKGLIECNWLQALEVGIDPAHASFLHRCFDDADPADGYGQQFRDVSDGGAMPMTRLLREFPRPEILVDAAAYGMRLTALRRIDERRIHVRVTNQVFPQAIVIPMSQEMTITQWHVPVDDETCYWYAIFTSYGAPVDKDAMRRQRRELYGLPDYVPKLNRRNRYGYSAAEQRDRTYTGMGADINVHDQWAVESQGRIQDRTREHLGKTDIGIIAHRRRLLAALDELAARPDAPDLPLLQVGRDDADGLYAVDAIVAADAWADGARAAARRRYAAAPWADDGARADSAAAARRPPPRSSPNAG